MALFSISVLLPQNKGVIESPIVLPEYPNEVSIKKEDTENIPLSPTSLFQGIEDGTVNDAVPIERPFSATETFRDSKYREEYDCKMNTVKLSLAGLEMESAAVRSDKTEEQEHIDCASNNLKEIKDDINEMKAKTDSALKNIEELKLKTESSLEDISYIKRRSRFFYGNRM